MRAVVLDAWAVLAYLREEQPAARIVVQYFTQAHNGTARIALSTINLGEVLYRLIRIEGTVAARRRVTRFRSGTPEIAIIGVREPLVLDAAELKAAHAFSYADAFAVATARQEGGVLLTGDPEILALPRSVVRTRALTRHSRK